MKLGELRGAIRKCKGNPVVLLPLPGDTMKLTVQKTLLLEELERLCPGGKNVETPFSFDLESGVLSTPIGPMAAEDLNEGDLVDALDALIDPVDALTDLDDDDLLV